MPRTRRTNREKKAAAQATAAKARQMTKRLRSLHTIGQKATQTKLSIAEFAAMNGISPHTLRKLKRFATSFSPEELDELCEPRRPGGLALHFGFVNFLLVVSDKRERTKLQQRAASEGWSAAQLAAAVPRKYRGQNPHGRPMSQPSSLVAGLEQLTGETYRLRRRAIMVRDLVRGRSGKQLSERVEALVTATTVLQRELNSLKKALRSLDGDR